MLRRFACAVQQLHPLNNYSKSILLHSRMSSEASVDVPKRKIEEVDDASQETNDKKLKSESVNNIIKRVYEETNKVRKPRKVVMLLSYLGKDFFGMQRNSNVDTVEEELLKALLKSNVILKSEFDFPKTMKFQRAARTDKGVSAVRQIVSLKIPLNEINDSLTEKVNEHLPPDVRLVDVKRVTQSFDAKIACDARTYSYMLPTFAFAPKELDNPEAYRITDERRQEVNEFLKKYVGTRNYYNFTSGRLPGDPSCKRYIMFFECGPPFESRGLEFSVIKVKGQSFMLHQIRKMVGLAVAILRNFADSSVLEKSWQNDRIDIPIAPGLGLMLEELHYDWYNKKFGSDGVHQALKWDEYEEQIETFKKERICSNIAIGEQEEKSMLQWLQTLPHHSFDVRVDGPPTPLPPKSENEKRNGSETLPVSESTENHVPDADLGANATDVQFSTPSESLCTPSQETEIKCES